MNCSRPKTGFVRDLGPVEYYLVSAIAIAWAVFQLSLPSFFIIASTKERAIHLAFAMTLLFLVCPFLKKTGKAPRAISPKGRVPLIDWLLALSGALTALYLAVYFKDIAMRAGSPTALDLLSGSLLVLLLLEAARRAVGPALSVIAVLFTLYAFLGPHMPDVLAFKGVSLSKYLSNIALSTEGIYGIPLGVSSSIVFVIDSSGCQGINGILSLPRARISNIDPFSFQILYGPDPRILGSHQGDRFGVDAEDRAKILPAGIRKGNKNRIIFENIAHTTA